MFHMMYPVLRLVLLSIEMLDIRDEADMAFRYKLSSAIASVTADEHEQNVLMSIARWESNFWERIAAPNCTCRKNECDGGRAKGSWQIIPYNRTEKAQLCVSLEDDAKLALGRIRESERACWANPANERLALYARGTCQTEEARRLSRVRWIK